MRNIDNPSLVPPQEPDANSGESVDINSASKPNAERVDATPKTVLEKITAEGKKSKGGKIDFADLQRQLMDEGTIVVPTEKTDRHDDREIERVIEQEGLIDPRDLKNSEIAKKVHQEGLQKLRDQRAAKEKAAAEQDAVADSLAYLNETDARWQKHAEENASTRFESGKEKKPWDDPQSIYSFESFKKRKAALSGEQPSDEDLKKEFGKEQEKIRQSKIDRLGLDKDTPLEKAIEIDDKRVRDHQKPGASEAEYRAGLIKATIQDPRYKAYGITEKSTYQDAMEARRLMNAAKLNLPKDASWEDIVVANRKARAEAKAQKTDQTENKTAISAKNTPASTARPGQKSKEQIEADANAPEADDYSILKGAEKDQKRKSEDEMAGEAADFIGRTYEEARKSTSGKKDKPAEEDLVEFEVLEEEAAAGSSPEGTPPGGPGRGPESPAGGSPERRDDVQKQMEAMIERMSKQEFDAMLDEVRKVLNRKLGQNENDSFASIAKKIKENPGILQRPEAPPTAPQQARGPESPAPARTPEGAPATPHTPEAPRPEGSPEGAHAPQTPETARPAEGTPAAPHAPERPAGGEMRTEQYNTRPRELFDIFSDLLESEHNLSYDEILAKEYRDLGLEDLTPEERAKRLTKEYKGLHKRAKEKGLITKGMTLNEAHRVLRIERKKAESKWTTWRGFKKKFKGLFGGYVDYIGDAAEQNRRMIEELEEARVRMDGAPEGRVEPAPAPGAESTPATPASPENNRETLARFAASNFEGFLKAAGKKIGMAGEITPERAAAALDAYENLNKANRG